MATLAVSDTLREASSLVQELERYLGDAKAVDTDAALKAMRRLHNLTFEKERSLLSQFFPHLLRFHHLDASGKAWLLEVIENVSLKHPDLTSFATSTWLAYLDDPVSNPLLVQRTLSSLARLYPRILTLLSTATFPSPALWSLWNAIKEITGKAFALLEQRPSPRLTFAAINFIVAVIISQSEPNPGDRKAIFRPSSLLNNPNAIVQNDTLTAQSPKMIRFLLGRLRHDAVPSSELVLTIGLLTKVFLRRHVHAPLVIQELVPPSHLPFTFSCFDLPLVAYVFLPEGVLPSVEKVIRMALFSAVRGRCPFDWTKTFEKVFLAYGGKSLMTRYKSSHINRALVADARNEPAASLEISSSLFARKTAPAPQSLDVRRLLRAGMPALANLSPALHRSLAVLDDVPLAEASATVFRHISNIKFPSELTPLTLPVHGDPNEDLYYSIRRKIKYSHVSDRMCDHLPSPNAKPLRCLTLCQDLTDPRMFKRQAMSLDLADPQPFSKDVAEHLVSAKYNTLIRGEDAARAAGQNVVRRALLCRLATSSERDGKRVIALFEYLLAEPAARVRLAQQWLFGEYFADEQRYRLMLEQFIEAYSRPGLSRVLVSFLGQLPLFDSSVLNQLTSLVLRDPSSTESGLAALQVAARSYPALRTDVVKVILHFTQHDELDVRTASIRMVASEMLDSVFVDAVESYAENLVNSLVTMPSAEVDALSPEQIESRLLLLFAICAKRTRQLSTIANIYVKANHEVRSAIINRIPGLVQHISMGDSALHHLVRTFDGKAMQLVFYILNTLTQSSQTKQPTPELVAVVMEVYERVQDPLLLLPILSGLSRDDVIHHLPALVSLPEKYRKSFLNRLLFQIKSLPVGDLIVQLHLIEAPEQLKKVIASLEYCLSRISVVKADVLSAALTQLADRNPLPKLFLRTVIQVIETRKNLRKFVLDLISHVLRTNSSIFSDTLWKGCLIALKLLHPESMAVVFSLPFNRFEMVVAFYRKNPKTLPFLSHLKRYADSPDATGVTTQQRQLLIESTKDDDMEVDTA